MAETQPPLFEQECYDADSLRLLIDAIAAGGEGVVAPGDCAVTPGTSGLTVQVSPGGVFVQGDTAGQGTYLCINGSVTTIALNGADPSQARIDRIVATVFDKAFGGATNTWKLQAIAGSPGGGAAAEPANSTTLATVTVRAGAVSVNAGDVSDLRQEASAPVWQ